MTMLQEEPTTPRKSTHWSAWLADPRTAVLGFLASALLIGGGRKVWQGMQARRAVAALEGPDPSVEEVEAVAEHGREGLIDLFRLLGTADKPEIRDAAGRALAVLWAKDDLIVEEEKALVRRGFAVDWKARRRYPRGLSVPIPIEAAYGVPFLVDGGVGVGPSSLEWSHRILGAERAGLEQPSPWTRGAGLARFTIEPGDFATLGPHRLALASRVRVVDLTDRWEIELPHLPFSFEFDPILTVEALWTTESDFRAEAFARQVGIEPSPAPESGSRYLALGTDLLLRDPPDLVVRPPIPCDLAHRREVEIEGVSGRFRSGAVVMVGSGDSAAVDPPKLRFPLVTIENFPEGAIDRPGDHRIRYHLTSDPNLGWADPKVRSLWPGSLTTEWASVRVVRH